MDFSRSESAHQAAPIGPVTLIIKQTPTELTIETRRRDPSKPSTHTSVVTYKLDGSETTATGGDGVTIKSKAHWDGSNLVTETEREIQGSTVTTMDVQSLDPDGKEMTVNKTVAVQHGYEFEGARTHGRGKDVFVRAKRATPN
jgi:hypothetical protein